MGETAASEPRTIVDVGIPTLGRPELVREAVESVCAQTLTAWRLAISENGPAGSETEAALGPYLEDPRITYSATGSVVSGQENWTRLIRRGDAPYVALLHDDDLWDPAFLERRVEFLERHPQCGFVFSGNREIDADGAVLRETRLVLPEGAYAPETFFPILYEHNVIGPPSILVRRDAYEAVGAYFDAEFNPYWDYEMWLRLAARFAAGYLNVRDCSYRMHDVRLTFTVRRYGASYLQAIDRADALLTESTEIVVPANRRRRRRARALLTTALDCFEAGERRSGAQHLRQAVRLHPRVVLDVRFPAGLAALIGGRPVAGALQRARYHVQHRGIRLHRR